MASKDGKAMMILTLAPGESLESAAQSILKNYQLSLVESEKTSVNNLETIVMVADQVNEQQQQGVRTLIYVIRHREQIYAMIGASVPEAFNSYITTFKGSMTRFNTLTDAEKINKKPERVRVKAVQRSGLLGEALKAHGVNDKRIGELATLNGMELSDRVENGMLIKVIE